MKANRLPALVLIVLSTLLLLSNPGLTSLNLGEVIRTWGAAILIVVAFACCSTIATESGSSGSPSR